MVLPGIGKGAAVALQHWDKVLAILDLLGPLVPGRKEVAQLRDEIRLAKAETERLGKMADEMRRELVEARVSLRRQQWVALGSLAVALASAGVTLWLLLHGR